jgi:hypothetical protein
MMSFGFYLQNETITCPQCHSETKLGPSGIDGLLCDFGVTGLIDTFVSGSADYQVTETSLLIGCKKSFLSIETCLKTLFSF